MICPHCRRTIREGERYLMSVDPHAPWPSWAASAITLVVCLAIIGLAALLRA
jgi:hypothetical protein